MIEWYMFGDVCQSETITVKEITDVMRTARTHLEAVKNVPEVYIP